MLYISSFSIASPYFFFLSFSPSFLPSFFLSFLSFYLFLSLPPHQACLLKCEVSPDKDPQPYPSCPTPEEVVLALPDARPWAERVLSLRHVVSWREVLAAMKMVIRKQPFDVENTGYKITSQ